jgi:hypothetical protein
MLDKNGQRCQAAKTVQFAAPCGVHQTDRLVAAVAHSKIIQQPSLAAQADSRAWLIDLRVSSLTLLSKVVT